MYSLRRRLLYSSIILLLLFFGAMGWALNLAFTDSVESNAESQLRNQILLLMSDIDVIDQSLSVPERVAEPRLSQTDSSLFAQIQSPDGNLLWRSTSLMDAALPPISAALGEFLFLPVTKQEASTRRYQMSLGVEWETEEGDFPFIIQVAEEANTYQQRIRRYQRQLAIWLTVMGGALVLLLLLALGWGLKPLQKVIQQVNDIETGKRQRFDEAFPQEISRLTQNLNQLLNFEEQRISRQKEVLGNLAHSLKTPIAVLSGLNYADENRAEAARQLQTMQNIIEYQLQSASAVGRRRFAKPVTVYSQTQQIISSLTKLHQAKQLRCQLDMDESLQFFGDPGDWMELVGNLLDNAFKWAESNIVVSVAEIALSNGQSHRQGVEVTVSDDGPGIGEELKHQILERGVRLDSQTPGHGLGLHIVKGIVEAYEGEIEIGDMEPQGTQFRVILR